MKNTAKWYCCTGSIIEIRESRQDFMPLNFPVEDIHLIVQLPVLFNACIKQGVVIDVFPYLVPHLQRIPAEDVLGYALAHPKSSVLDISKACSYSKSTVWNILHTYGAYPYRPVLAQELMSGDQELRFNFCNFVLNTLDENPDFFNEVLWSDECQFSRQGTINTQNRHYWSLENPHLLRPNCHQIVRVQYFVRGGSVGHRSRASSKHLSPHLPVDELDSSVGQTGVALHLQMHV
ncbi:uncharacterized protein TNCV_1296591 [Trichonephila clavipes]|uniref:Transposase n=1 Tax=Trichonephila clavipes TaxID=2585209 RepID=A0A8X6SW42_TRICX|nr:uncharacterized protein TNCV_1296591 [Trichonephila clavipes]